MRIRLVSVVAIALLVCSTAQAQNSAPAGSLKIVVISGEDAVNIIQQKTAVAPVIEVRDRNDLPVLGVSVTFSVSGPGPRLREACNPSPWSRMPRARRQRPV